MSGDVFQTELYWFVRTCLGAFSRVVVTPRVADLGRWLVLIARRDTSSRSPSSSWRPRASGRPATQADMRLALLRTSVETHEAVEILKSHPFLTRGGTLQLHEAIAI